MASSTPSQTNGPSTPRPPTVTIWLRAARPRTLPAGACPVIIGTALAYDAGGFHAISAAAALIGALLIQIGTNFANDYFDFVKGVDTAERLGPTRATQAGLVAPNAMRRAMIIAFALVFIPGAYILYRGGLPFLVIGLASILCGVLYTGGPYPLGYLGLGDLFVLIFFGPVAVAGTYYLQTLAFDPNVIIAGLAPGLFSVAILTVNNLRDADTDRAARKKTLAVRFGKTFAKLEYTTALAAASLAVPVYLVSAAGTSPWTLLAVLTLLAAIPAVRTVWTKSDGPALNAVLAATGKLLILFTALFSIHAFF